MRVVVVKRNQGGAILTFELSILMVLVASIAIGAGVIIGSKLPQVLNAWLDAAAVATTYTAFGNLENACNVANGDSINQLAGNLFNNTLKAPYNPACEYASQAFLSSVIGGSPTN
ncbi:MAG: hypothetical protein WC627_00115 [Legionella sp.]|jgi:hypothetical protein